MRLLTAGLLAFGFSLPHGDVAQAASPTRVFLHATPGPQVERRCLRPLLDTFKSDVGKTKGLDLAASRAKADIVVDVSECIVTDSPQRGGVIGVGRTGSEYGTTDTISTSAHTGTGSTVGRVTLTVDVGGETKEFGSGSEGLPIDDAAHAATKVLIDWVGSGARAESR